MEEDNKEGLSGSDSDSEAPRVDWNDPDNLIKGYLRPKVEPSQKAMDYILKETSKQGISITLPEGSPGARYNTFVYLWSNKDHYLECEILEGKTLEFFYKHRPSGEVWSGSANMKGGMPEEVLEKLVLFETRSSGFKRGVNAFPGCTLEDFKGTVCLMFPDSSDQVMAHTLDNSKGYLFGSALYGVALTGHEVHHIYYYPSGEWYYMSEGIEGVGQSLGEAIERHWEAYKRENYGVRLSFYDRIVGLLKQRVPVLISRLSSKY